MTILDEKVEELKHVLELDAETKRDLGLIELNVVGKYTLADAMRDGSRVSQQSVGSWGNGEQACALTAAYMGAKAHNIVQ